MAENKKSAKRLYLAMACAAFALGALPALINLGVDPYQLFFAKDRSTKMNDIAEKKHYPLWKLAKFKRNTHDTIILGDSRARALRDKYWHELNVPGALNLAYGGGTLPEVFSTFNAIKNDSKIRNLVIGIQLRSFDEDHKGGMNRVPEALRLVRNKLEYLKNWDVFQTSLDMFESEYEQELASVGSFIPAAKAAELGREGQTPLTTLLQPEVCFGCDLPLDLPPVVAPQRTNRYSYRSAYLLSGTGLGWGLSDSDWRTGQSLYRLASLPAELPKKFSRQVDKNGKSDWRGFEFSMKYWGYIQQIGDWAKANDKNLIFVIPPTITNMQATISENGLGKLNHQLRMKLGEIGTVLDFDFPNEMTGNITNFNDAYHFNSKVARQIVGQIIPHITDDKKAIKTARKREAALRCIRQNTDAKQLASALPAALISSGQNCRVWGNRK